MFQGTETLKKTPSILGNRNPKKLLMFQEVTFWAQKLKKPTLEKLLLFQKVTFNTWKSNISYKEPKFSKIKILDYNCNIVFFFNYIIFFSILNKLLFFIFWEIFAMLMITLIFFLERFWYLSRAFFCSLSLFSFIIISW